MDQEKIGVFISTLRKEQGMTQQQLVSVTKQYPNGNVAKECRNWH